MVRTVVSYVLEAVGVLLVALVLFVNFGWSWAVAPVAIYLLVLGVQLGGDRR